jgi:ankyrin repeat protein
MSPTKDDLFAQLYGAIGRDDALAVEALIKQGVNLNAKEEDAPIYYACESPVIVNLLLEAGADPYAYGGEGDNVLSLVACCGCVETVLILMSHGVSPNCQRPRSGWTPIMDAILEGHKEVFDILLAYGADLRIRNEERENAFEIARQFNRESWVEPYRSRTDKTLMMW